MVNKYETIGNVAIIFSNTGNHEIKVDVNKLKLLLKHCWTVDDLGRAFTYINKKPVFMHRLLKGVVGGDKNIRIDHKNGKPLDNRMRNLRLSNASTNGMNSKLSKGSITGFKGVTKNDNSKKWQVDITCRIPYNLGRHEDIKIARIVHDIAEDLLFGKFANTSLRGYKTKTYKQLYAQNFNNVFIKIIETENKNTTRVVAFD